MKKIYKFKGLSRTTAKLLALTKVVELPELPTCAVGFKDGKATLFLGAAYLNATTNDAREHMLRHEAHHLMLQHSARQGDRDDRKWNLATDAAIHLGTSVDLDVIEAGTGVRGVTFESLHVRPCPPEICYDLLPNHPTGGGGGEECGRDKLPEEYTDGSGSSQATEQVVAAEVAEAWRFDCEERGEFDSRTDRENCNPESAGLGHGAGRQPAQVHKVPKWVGDVLDRVMKGISPDERTRSWKREHRYIESGLLPGRVRGQGWAGIWLIDASGSINSEWVNDMLSAVVGTPELAHSLVGVFDTQLSPIVPVSDREAIDEAIRNCGGGTSIKAVGQFLDIRGYEDYPRVWLTDAYSHDGLPPRREQDVWVLFRRPEPKVVDYPSSY